MSKPDTIDELVLFDKDTHDKSCGVTITRDLGNCDCDKLELKAALSAMVAEIIGEDEPTFGAQNEAGDISEDDYITYGRSSVRAEQRQRAIDMGFTL